MATKVYGENDDLIKFVGDVHGEAGASGAGYDDGVLLFCSDGTVLAMKYGYGYLGDHGDPQGGTL